MATAATAVIPEDVHARGRQLESVVERIASRSARGEARSRARIYLVGLLGPVQRKNAWQLAEQVGDESPYFATKTELAKAMLSRAFAELDRLASADHAGVPGPCDPGRGEEGGPGGSPKKSEDGHELIG